MWKEIRDWINGSWQPSGRTADVAGLMTDDEVLPKIRALGIPEWDLPPLPSASDGTAKASDERSWQDEQASHLAGHVDTPAMAPARVWSAAELPEDRYCLYVTETGDLEADIYDEAGNVITLTYPDDHTDQDDEGDGWDTHGLD